MMNELWLKSQEYSGVCGHDGDISSDSPDAADTTPVTDEIIQIRNDYRRASARFLWSLLAVAA
jgi:hypothetical protein